MLPVRSPAVCWIGVEACTRSNARHHGVVRCARLESKTSVPRFGERISLVSSPGKKSRCWTDYGHETRHTDWSNSAAERCDAIKQPCMRAYRTASRYHSRHLTRDRPQRIGTHVARHVFYLQTCNVHFQAGTVPSPSLDAVVIQRATLKLILLSAVTRIREAADRANVASTTPYSTASRWCTQSCRSYAYAGQVTRRWPAESGCGQYTVIGSRK